MTTISYIGSKLSLIGWLLEAFDLEHIKTFAEPMCGTGVVSEAVARSGIKVFANDICSYASILTASRVVSFNQSLYDTYFKKFMEIADEDELDEDGFVYMNYAETGSDRLYFTGENAKKIDACRALLEKATDLDTNTRNALIATILISADKVANTASVYGAFLKHIKRTAAQSITFQRIISSTVGSTHVVANGDAILFLASLPERVDLIYIDPPYTNRGYCSNYHVLETIALYDNPTIRGITGLRHDCLEKNTDTSKKSTCLRYYQKLIQIASQKAKVLLFSYSSDGMVSIDELVSIMSAFGTVVAKEVDYKKFTTRSSSDTVKEYLIKCAFS